VLERWGLPPSAASNVALLLVTAGISYVSLVLGELVPKRLALQRAEPMALFAAPVLDRLATAARPVIWLLSRSTNLVVRLLGLDPDADPDDVTEEELRHLVGSHEDLGTQERQVLSDVFDAADRQLSDVMVPRTQVAFLDAETELAEAAQLVIGQPHSRYPVIRDTPDNVIGFIHVRDLLTPVADQVEAAGAERPTMLADIVRPITALPGTNTVLATLMLLRSGTGHIALVVDEFGGTDGIVTLEDLIEELVGEIQDEYDLGTETPWSSTSQTHDLEAGMHRDELAQHTGIELPEGRFETLGGFVMARLQRIPAVGDFVDHDGHRYTVTQTDHRRPVCVRVSTTPVAPPAGILGTPPAAGPQGPATVEGTASA
jgi:putative hemolysin